MTTIYPLIMGRRAILATEHYLSAAAGAGIFARSGNAIDAAVAATFVEGVVNPHMHTIGGEAPMLIYSAIARRVVALNGNMMAPARATIEHYRSLGVELIPGAGLLAAGVPAAFDALVSPVLMRAKVTSSPAPARRFARTLIVFSPSGRRRRESIYLTAKCRGRA